MLLQGQILQGLGFLLFGLVFILLVWALLRFAPRIRPIVQEPIQIPFAQIQTHTDAAMVVEMGGRVRFINKIASEWFELAEGETPNIERLSRRVRPGEGFLEICATEGQARFSVNGRLVDAVSYRVPGSMPAIAAAPPAWTS